MIYLAFLFVLLVSPVHAATLLWDIQPTGGGALIIERGTVATGPFSIVATLPQGSTQFVLTPGQWGFYRVRNTVGPSNVVQYSADLYSGGLIDRIDRIESRLTTMENSLSTVNAAPPIPTSNFTVTVIDVDHIRLFCNGVGVTTSGSGVSRTLECRH